MKITDINVRDPFVLTLPEEKCYLLFGSDGKNCWGGRAIRGWCFVMSGGKSKMARWMCA